MLLIGNVWELFAIFIGIFGPCKEFSDGSWLEVLGVLFADESCCLEQRKEVHILKLLALFKGILLLMKVLSLRIRQRINLLFGIS